MTNRNRLFLQCADFPLPGVPFSSTMVKPERGEVLGRVRVRGGVVWRRGFTVWSRPCSLPGSSSSAQPLSGCRSTLTFSPVLIIPMVGYKPPTGSRSSRRPTTFPFLVKNTCSTQQEVVLALLFFDCVISFLINLEATFGAVPIPYFRNQYDTDISLHITPV